jgi:competence protein ComEC
MKLIIKIYDVEHGSCSHIITPNNKHILIDVGSKSEKSIVDHIRGKYFYGYQTPRIDKLFITHPHEDHIYDLPNLYNTLKPRVIHRPKEAFDIKPSCDTEIHKKIAEYANKMNREYTYPVQDYENVDRAEVNGGVNITVITPKTEWTTKEDLNTFSDIIIAESLGYKAIFTGDNPKKILDKMMAENYCDIRNLISDATFLIAPHHGRTGEFCDSFFKCVNPYITIVSDKSIAHSTQNETSQLYKGRGVKFGEGVRYVVTTRNDGTITIRISEDECNISMDKEEY